MIHEETVEAYTKAHNEELAVASDEKEFLMSNETNVFWHPEIPEDTEYKIREYFKIDSPETILLLSDVSLSQERNEGVTVTDRGVYFIYPDGTRENLSWQEIDRVMYYANGDKLDFFCVEREKVSVELKLFLGGAKKKGVKAKSILAQTIPVVGPLIAIGMASDDIDEANERRRKTGESLARIFSAMAETQKPENIDLVEQFYELPYDKRKVIMLTKQHSEPRKTPSCIFFNLDHRPEIEFQLKRPVVNQLYVGHPYNPKMYFPLEEYKMELFLEKLDEFCKIMRSLGAEEIDIEDCRNSDESKEASTNKKVKGNAGNDEKNVSAGWEKSTVNKFMESLGRRVKLHQICEPSWNPVLPENLVWYKYEPSWQRKYDARTGNSSVLEIEELIETSRSSEISNSEWKKITAAVKAEKVDIGAEWERSMEEKLSSQENTVLSIKVKFASLESLPGYDSSKRIGKKPE